MPTSYPGSPVYAANISTPLDSDPPDAASISVPLQQLADRTRYLKDLVEAGIGFELTDAVLHGNTTFPDGTIAATLDSVSIVTTGTIAIAAYTDNLFLGGDSITIGSTTTVTVNTTTDFDVNATGDINLDVGSTSAVVITGGASSVLDVFGGRFIVNATGAVEIGTDCTIGSSGDTTTVGGDLVVVGTVDVTGDTTLGRLYLGEINLASGFVIADGSLWNFAGNLPVRVSGRMSLEDKGNIVVRMVDVTTTGSYGIDDGTDFYVMVGTLGETFTVPNTNAVRGTRVRWYSNAPGDNTLKQANGSTTICVLDYTATTGEYVWVELTNDGLGNAANSWRITGGQKAL